MNVQKHAHAAPPLQKLSQLRRGSVYVAEEVAPGSVVPGLREGESLVLGTAGHPRALELVGEATTTAAIATKGTYLSPADFDALKSTASPTLRKYRVLDTWAKALSARGAAVVAPLVVTLLTAVVGIFFLVSASRAPSGVDRAAALFEWVGQPAIGGGTASEVAKRAERAQRCMALVEGHPAPPTRIPGIPCSPPPAAWWQSATVGSLLAAGLAVVAALLAFVPLRARFGFQGSTAG